MSRKQISAIYKVLRTDQLETWVLDIPSNQKETHFLTGYCLFDMPKNFISGALTTCQRMKSCQSVLFFFFFFFFCSHRGNPEIDRKRTSSQLQNSASFIRSWPSLHWFWKSNDLHVSALLAETITLIFVKTETIQACTRSTSWSRWLPQRRKKRALPHKGNKRAQVRATETGFQWQLVS